MIQMTESYLIKQIEMKIGNYLEFELAPLSNNDNPEIGILILHYSYLIFEQKPCNKMNQF